MRYFALLFLFLCIITVTQAQKDSICQIVIKKNYGSAFIQLPLKRKNYNFPPVFNSIQVVDCRQDTSRLGLATRGLPKGQILFHTTAADEISTFLSLNFTDPKGDRSLLVAIKDLWLYDDVDSTIEESFKKTIYTRPQGNLVFRCEAYLQVGEGYLPLTYLDTVLASTLHKSLGMGEAKLPDLLAIFMNKVASVDVDAISKRRRVISYNAIDSFSRTRYNYPMDTAITLKKGVYANVDEFLNNQPSIAEYEIVKNPNAEMELRIRDENGTFYYTHKMWGFCDGRYCYVMMDGTLFPILPVQHTFYVLGSKAYKAKKVHIPLFIAFPGAYLYGFDTASETIIKKLTLFRLDVRSGEIIQ
ncbi:hypothetical protein Q4E93_16740 [Flavitalea sp. BT771]|uniref:hypothetical protein n=1 Tax=Flavitalea sp. BT771 TaxID=3063329 RepID=UPI0026E25F8C|nr:hypothetical protein [Flavitalea sp. BT771]MDO6432251.1 hypothetical protein [Flavitalea sp. BT771]MDV6221161.1 hypothetical protein [Flavitalea sp. BT771]